MIISEGTSQTPRKSDLEMTLEDHVNIGSTPPEILKQNPGKTKGELLSDEELRNYLESKQQLIGLLSSEENPFAQSALKDSKEDWESTKTYLTKIGRMSQSDKLGL